MLLRAVRGVLNARLRTLAFAEHCIFWGGVQPRSHISERQQVQYGHALPYLWNFVSVRERHP